MNILDLCLTPLTDEELIFIDMHYVQNFNKMSLDSALALLHMLLMASGDYIDDELKHLLIRRLAMIIEWDKYPERLI